MPQTLTLQLASSNDANDISRMSAVLIEQGLPHTWTAQRVRAHIRHRDSTVLVAKHTNLLGFAIMQFGDVSAHLNLLAVNPWVRRRGVGRSLVAWLHESAITAGTFAISLELRADNVEARRFYESMGYAESGRISNYYSNSEDALRMTRDLSVRDTF